MPASLPPAGVRARLRTGARRQPRILVAGLGSALMRDDGAGVEACRSLRALRPRPVHFLVAEVGTAIYGALHLLEWADHILVVDAMQAGGAPGSLYLATGKDLEVNHARASLHEVSLLGALCLLPRRPRHVRVLGIEPESLAPGEGLSAPVAAVMPAAVEWAMRIVSAWARPR
jgi:hydrogenase maturation protease